MSLSSFQQFSYDTVLIITFQILDILIYISLNVIWEIMTCDNSFYLTFGLLEHIKRWKDQKCMNIFWMYRIWFFIFLFIFFELLTMNRIRNPLLPTSMKIAISPFFCAIFSWFWGVSTAHVELYDSMIALFSWAHWLF